MSELIKAQQSLDAQIDAVINEVKQSTAWSDMVKDLEDFQNEPYNGQYFMDESGFLCSQQDIDLSTVLEVAYEFCRDNNGGGDFELLSLVQDSLIQEIQDLYICITFILDQDSQHSGDFIFIMQQGLGEPIIYNEIPERDHWAIYSNGLGLKIDKRDIVDSEHGFMLIEQAMRKHGVFEPIVESDYYGTPTLITTPKHITDMSDDELERAIDIKENSEVES
jgi:hypothetical protein